MTSLVAPSAPLRARPIVSARKPADPDARRCHPRAPPVPDPEVARAISRSARCSRL